MAWTIALVVACTPYVHSPPGRTFPLESAKALNPRETGIQVEGGGGVSGDVGLPGMTARVRFGAVRKLDVNGEFSFTRIRPSVDVPTIESRPFLLTGRVGLKYAFIEHVAIAAGLAAGGWAGGSFLSPDLSAILSYENRYVVPFLDFGGYTSHPLRTFDLVVPELNQIDFIGRPVLTYGWTVGLGMRIPVTHDSAPATAPALLLGVRFRGAYFDDSYLVQGDSIEGRRQEIYFYGSVGFEYIVAPRSVRNAARQRGSRERSFGPRIVGARR